MGKRKKKLDAEDVRQALHKIAEARDELDEAIMEFRQELDEKFKIEVEPLMDGVNEAIEGAAKLLNDQKEAA